MNNNTKLFVTALILCISLSFLCGCTSVYGSNEDIKNTKFWGESVTITNEFDLLNIYHRGPYEIEITPIGLTQVGEGSRLVDCIEIRYLVIATPDGEGAEYAVSVTAINCLQENFGEVKTSVWFIDKSGTRYPDIREGKLIVGTPYVFYIPIDYGAESSGLYWLTVSDRSGYYARSGESYWYRIEY